MVVEDFGWAQRFAAAMTASFLQLLRVLQLAGKVFSSGRACRSGWKPLNDWARSTARVELVPFPFVPHSKEFCNLSALKSLLPSSKIPCFGA
jgi:hypothetical protein